MIKHPPHRRSPCARSPTTPSTPPPSSTSAKSSPRRATISWTANRNRLEVLDQDAGVTDDAEHAVFATDQQFQLRLAGKDRKLLGLIDHALDKIEQGEHGEYGLCEGTGEPIPRARLELRPWARYSVEHKMVLERERALHSPD